MFLETSDLVKVVLAQIYKKYFQKCFTFVDWTWFNQVLSGNI